MFERTVLRIGAVSFVAGLAAAVVFEVLHPSRENPNNNPLVFTEYAHAGDWITVHLGALAGTLLLIGDGGTGGAVASWAVPGVAPGTRTGRRAAGSRHVAGGAVAEGLP
jgi:hypothetical protein